MSKNVKTPYDDELDILIFFYKKMIQELENFASRLNDNTPVGSVKSWVEFMELKDKMGHKIRGLQSRKEDFLYELEFKENS